MKVMYVIETIRDFLELSENDMVTYRGIKYVITNIMKTETREDYLNYVELKDILNEMNILLYIPKEKELN